MIAGVHAWGELFKAAFGTISMGLAATEVMIASGKVVGARSTIIGDALRRPMDCDHVELGGMLPEKLLAFSKSASVLLNHWVSTVLDVSEQAHQAGLLACQGRALHPVELSGFADRSIARGTKIMTRTIEVGGLVLAPVHQQVTANAKRLDRGR